MKKTLQDLVVSAFGATTSIATAIILFFIEVRFGFSLYTWIFFFVIPVGAMLSGFLAAGGYYLGARLFSLRPTPLILLNMVAISVGTFFLIHFLGYAVLEVEGKQVSDYISFGTYLDILIRHQSVGFYFHAKEVGSTGELGSWGYVYALLQIGGFAFGGFCVFGYLFLLPYCDTCSRYLSGRAKQERFAGDSDAFALMVGELATAFDAGRPQEAINQHAAIAETSHRKELHLKSTLKLKKCRGCGKNWLGFSVQKSTGRDWKDINKLELSTFHEGELNLPG